jgi:hypothetical protein
LNVVVKGLDFMRLKRRFKPLFKQFPTLGSDLGAWSAAFVSGQKDGSKN